MVDHGRGEEAHRTECHLDRRGGGCHGVLVLEHVPGGLDEGRLQHLRQPEEETGELDVGEQESWRAGRVVSKTLHIDAVPSRPQGRHHGQHRYILHQVPRPCERR